MATIGVVVLVTTGSRSEGSNGGLISGILFGGWALTFLLLWLRRASQPTEWAKYPAGVLAGMAILALGLGVTSLSYIWPLAIILVGAFLLFTSLRNRSA
jgi:hypothetical protein